MNQSEFFVRCASGFEPLLSDELKALRIKRTRPLKGGVAFFGGIEDAYQVCLWSRVASRVLLILTRGKSATAEELYETVKAFPWEDHLKNDATIAMYAKGTNESIRNTQFLAVKAKDAVCDRMRDVCGSRPSVETNRPDVLIDVSLRGDRLTIALDLSGEPLHRRGYRAPGVQGPAPLKENLAAAIVLTAGWEQLMQQQKSFLDPMCGSGTLAIEAAMIAGDIAPGILRDYWGFFGWTLHDEALWNRVVDDADERAIRGKSRIPSIMASDIDARSIALARDNARRAMLEEYITFEVMEAADASEKFLLQQNDVSKQGGLLAVNPPYGTRLGTKESLVDTYHALKECIDHLPQTWEVAIITPDESLDMILRKTPFRKTDFYNGKIATQLRHYRLSDSVENTISIMPLHKQDPIAVSVFDKNSEQFAARLRKVAKERQKWARRNKISCYRVYDADLPDYSIALDVYEGAKEFAGSTFLHVAEYQAPKTIEEERAQRRFADAVSVAPVVLDIPESNTFTKVRRREKGGGQYSEQKRTSYVIFVQENDHIFEVDLNGYLDTGIFLDHRITRERVASLAPGSRFLNLFAYTGTASVYAAGGGAKETTTVDLSHTYTEWARRNMERNGFTGDAHRFIKADVLKWVESAIEEKQRYDLIFVDPPTFSNSKSMTEGTWSVQRDHVALLQKLSLLLSDSGQIVFSCNLRNFKIDTDALASSHLQVADISAETIPDDFKRNQKIHKCFILTHKGTHS